jgi:hypothetical protein
VLPSSRYPSLRGGVESRQAGLASHLWGNTHTSVWRRYTLVVSLRYIRLYSIVPKDRRPLRRPLRHPLHLRVCGCGDAAG